MPLPLREVTRRALLVGAQTYGLEGVVRDVDAMERALAKRGFAVRRLTGSRATRDGILAAYERLIEDTGTGDVALVYYAGHGGYAAPLPGEPLEVAAVNRQFIVPADFAETSPGDFRGITAVELSVLLDRLTARTGTAVVILDCCHSAMMSRDPGEARIRQLPHVVQVDLDRHVRRRLGAGLPGRPGGNPDAVRLVACGDLEAAYEVPDAAGDGAYGLFTHSLIRALDAADGTRATWSQIIARVRELIEPTRLPQRPEAEGPAHRVLFETGPGDEAALPLPSTTRVPVLMPAGFPVASDFARPAGPGEDADIRVEAAGDGLFTLHDRIGALGGPRSADLVRDDLERVTRALVLLGIRAEAEWTFTPEITLEWGLDGGAPLPLAGAVVHDGDAIRLRVRNDSGGPVYLSLVDVGVSYAITLLTDLAPSGLRLRPGDEYVFDGARLAWPASVSRAAPRPETVLAVITSAQHDLGLVPQTGVRDVRAARDLRRPVRYCAPSLTFTLDPAERP